MSLECKFPPTPSFHSATQVYIFHMMGSKLPPLVTESALTVVSPPPFCLTCVTKSQLSGRYLITVMRKDNYLRAIGKKTT